MSFGDAQIFLVTWKNVQFDILKFFLTKFVIFMFKKNV